MTQEIRIERTYRATLAQGSTTVRPLHHCGGRVIEQTE